LWESVSRPVIRDRVVRIVFVFIALEFMCAYWRWDVLYFVVGMIARVFRDQ
jgi:hypothetical protein